MYKKHFKVDNNYHSILKRFEPNLFRCTLYTVQCTVYTVTGVNHGNVSQVTTSKSWVDFPDFEYCNPTFNGANLSSIT